MMLTIMMMMMISAAGLNLNFTPHLARQSLSTVKDEGLSVVSMSSATDSAFSTTAPPPAPAPSFSTILMVVEAAEVAAGVPPSSHPKAKNGKADTKTAASSVSQRRVGVASTAAMSKDFVDDNGNNMESGGATGEQTLAKRPGGEALLRSSGLGLGYGHGQARPQTSKVLEWTVEDVAAWMRYTVGYAEYTPLIDKHLIDGVTLLEMTGADFENFFPIESPLHAIKIDAHIKRLRRECPCGAAAAAAAQDSSKEAVQEVNLWFQIREHTRRTCFLGYLATHFSRVAMVSSYMFYPEVYQHFITPSSALYAGSSSPELNDDSYDSEDTNTNTNNDDKNENVHNNSSWTRKALYWICFFIAPDLYFAVQAMGYVSASYVLMPIFILHFIVQATAEYQLLYKLIRGQNPLQGQGFFGALWALYGIDPVVPLIGLIVSFLPVFCAYITTFILGVWVLVLGVAGVGVMVMEILEARKGDAASTKEAEEQPQQQKKSHDNNNNYSDPTNSHQDGEEENTNTTSNRDHRSSHSDPQKGSENNGDGETMPLSNESLD